MRSLPLTLLAGLVLGLVISPPASADVFYSIGPDVLGQPRSLNSIPSGGGAPTSLFDLGDGSLGFNGGLTVGPGNQFYAVANDGLGNSTLQSFTLGGGGALTNVLSLGSGFLNGVTYDSADGFLYAVSTDSTGDSLLNRIDLNTSSVSAVKDLGVGFEGGGLFNGGLTFDSSDGQLYAIGFDGGSGASRALYSISTSTFSVTSLFNLGDGSVSFNGGVLFNPADGLFYAIANDGAGNSTLDSFTLGGGGAFNTISSLGSGFNNVGLTEIPATAGVPEPPSWLLLAALGSMILGKGILKPGMSR